MNQGQIRGRGRGWKGATHPGAIYHIHVFNFTHPHSVLRIYVFYFFTDSRVLIKLFNFVTLDHRALNTSLQLGLYTFILLYF